MFLVFLSTVFCWTNQMMAIAGEIGLRQIGFSAQKKLNLVFNNAGDEFTRVSQAAAWLYYAERPPFNIASFNHWHFYSQPINEENLELDHYIDVDNLRDNLYKIRNSVRGGKVTRTWPFSFNLKLYLAGMCDVYSPLHVSEYFDSKFKDGDRNGRDFYVNFNGKLTSLYDVWESGCGFFDTSISFDSDADWQRIDKLVDQLSVAFSTEDWPASFDLDFTVKSTYNFTRDFVYKGITNGSTLSKEYISKCQDYTQDAVVQAGRMIANDISGLDIISIAKQIPYATGIRSSEVAAWSILFIITPFAALLIWKKHFSNTSY